MMKIYMFLLVLLIPVSVSAQTRAGGRVPADVFFDKGKLTFQSADKKFKFWFDNRIYIDAAGYLPTTETEEFLSKPNKDLEFDDGDFRFNNGATLRRVRFAIKSSLGKWNTEMDIDFALNEIEIEDMYVGYNFNDHLSLKVGNFKEPMSMERLVSSKYLVGMERPMAAEMFGGGRKLGAALTVWDRHWWVSGGFFGSEVSILQKEKNRGSDGHGFTGRLAVSPIAREDMTLHIGAYGTYRTPEANGLGNRLVEFRTFPESRVDRRRFVRAEIFDVNHYTTAGFELSYRYEKLLLSGEYMFTTLSRYRAPGGVREPLRNAEFEGWYASASYMILGSQRRYAPEDAEFGPMDIRPRSGNLEIALRAGGVNLNDFHDPRAIITGGRATSYNASLNWFPTNNLLIALNYTYMDNDKYADDKGHITVNSEPLRTALPSGPTWTICYKTEDHN